MWKYKGMKVKKIYIQYNVTFMIIIIIIWALMEKGKTYKES